jgi:hypothetical protein
MSLKTFGGSRSRMAAGRLRAPECVGGADVAKSCGALREHFDVSSISDRQKRALHVGVGDEVSHGARPLDLSFLKDINAVRHELGEMNVLL